MIRTLSHSFRSFAVAPIHTHHHIIPQICCIRTISTTASATTSISTSVSTLTSTSTCTTSSNANLKTSHCIHPNRSNPVRTRPDAETKRAMKQQQLEQKRITMMEQDEAIMKQEKQQIYTCPMCKSSETVPFQRMHQRSYWECMSCTLLFMLPQYHLPLDTMKLRYDEHINDPTDESYRNFLKRLLDPLTPSLSPNSYGLDFGSGPGPTISLIMAERGHRMINYDTIYAPLTHQQLHSHRFDFITCSECVEHFIHPYDEWKLMNSILNHEKDTYIAIMTQRFPHERQPITASTHESSSVPSTTASAPSPPSTSLTSWSSTALDFARTWWYARDPTHVVFYQLSTMRWIAHHFRWELIYHDKAVYIFRRSANPTS